MQNRSKWTREQYAKEIAKLREDAQRLRAMAERRDGQADQLRKECAAMSTDNLPLFENESR